MEKLPPEILHRLFINLPLYDRLECMLVCQNWWRILDKYSLLYNVTIVEDGDSDNFTRFMEMIKQFPHRAAHLQELKTMNGPDPSFNRRELCNIFPNARVMKINWCMGDGDVDHYLQPGEPIETKHSNSKIRILYDTIYCDVISQMLEFNLCGQLIELDLNFCFKNPIILPQLKNLPLLTKLGLHLVTLSVRDLEMIHTEIPTVEDFFLSFVSIAPGEAPSNVEPAPCIKTIVAVLVGADDVETYFQLYRYLNKKYVNALDIEHHDWGLEGLSPIDAKQVYLDGVIDYLKLIAQKTNKLTLCSVPDDIDIFDELDTVHPRIYEFRFRNCESNTLVKDFSYSRLSDHVEKFEIDRSILGSLNSLKMLTSIRTVNLTFPEEGTVLNLTQYFNAFPRTVKDCSMTVTTFIMDPFAIESTFIQNFTFNSRELTSDFGITISTCFPHLVNLSLVGRLIENTSIILDQLTFEYANIYLKGPIYHGFIFRTGLQVQPEYYRCKKKQTPVPTTYEVIKDYDILSITSVRKRRLSLRDFIHIHAY